METTDTLVFGAGISGLTACHYLHKKGTDFRLIESSHRVGGVIRTDKTGAYQIEKGPNSIMLNENVQTLINELGIGHKVLTAPDVEKNRYLYFNGKLTLAKPGPGILKTGLIPFASIMAFLREPFIKPTAKDDESIAEFFSRRLNKDILENLINPMVSGVYAGDPARLSLRSTFKKLYAMEQEYGSLIKAAIKKRKEKKFKRILTSFKGGLSTFTDSLASGFRDKIWYNTEVTTVKKEADGYLVTVLRDHSPVTIKCQRIISTIATKATATVFPDLAENLKHELRQVFYAPMLLLYLAYSKDDIAFNPDGFGFLIPQKEKMPFLGAIWSSALFPQVAPASELLSTVFVGGANNTAVVEQAENQAATAAESFAGVMGIQAGPKFKEFYLKKEAIPQFHVGYYKIQQAIDAFEQANPGLYISGNWRSGVAIGDCVDYNKNLVINNF